MTINFLYFVEIFGSLKTGRIGVYSHFNSKGHIMAVGCIGVYSHFNSKCHIMAVGDAHVFPDFLIPVLTQFFFPKPPTTFLTCFCRGEMRKYAGKKVRLNWGSFVEEDLSTTKGFGMCQPAWTANVDASRYFLQLLNFLQISKFWIRPN